MIRQYAKGDGMKLSILFLVSVCCWGTSQAYADLLKACGSAGDVIPINKIEPDMVAIPLVCRENRQDNYASAPPEAGLSTNDICNLASHPKDGYKPNNPPIPTKNMSACFCYSGVFPSSGQRTKCWTFYDRDE
jgi:hypothetical protein